MASLKILLENFVIPTIFFMLVTDLRYEHPLKIGIFYVHYHRSQMDKQTSSN